MLKNWPQVGIHNNVRFDLGLHFMMVLGVRPDRNAFTGFLPACE